MHLLASQSDMCEIALMDTLVDHDDAFAQLRGLLENAGDDRKRLLDAVSCVFRPS